MKATVLLRNDHEALRALFDKLNKPSARNHNGKKELLSEIRRELLVHGQIEKDIFYPALSATASATAAGLVAKAEQQHHAIEKLIQELSGVNGSDKNFETRMAALRESVMEHMDMEEEQMFDEARKNMSEYRLEELGLEIEDRRKILVTIAA